MEFIAAIVFEQHIRDGLLAVSIVDGIPPGFSGGWMPHETRGVPPQKFGPKGLQIEDKRKKATKRERGDQKIRKDMRRRLPAPPLEPAATSQEQVDGPSGNVAAPTYCTRLCEPTRLPLGPRMVAYSGVGSRV